MKNTWVLLAVGSILLVGCKPPKSVANQRLLDAVQSHSLKGVQEAIAQGADPNFIDSKPSRGFTVLEESVEVPLIEAELLKAGATPTKLDTNGLQPLGMAAGAGSIESMQLLIKAGVSVNSKDKNGTSPLCEAASSGKVDNALFLLTCGADVNASDNLGFTPLFHALLGAFTKPAIKLTLMRAFINLGANISAKDKSGRTVLAYCKTPMFRQGGDYAEIVKLLSPAPIRATVPSKSDGTTKSVVKQP